MFYNDELSVGKADLMLFSDHVYWKQQTNQLNVFSTLVLSGLCTSVLILKDFFFSISIFYKPITCKTNKDYRNSGKCLTTNILKAYAMCENFIFH